MSTKKSFNSVFTNNDHKSSCCIVVTSVFLMLTLSLLSYQYSSSYETTFTATSIGFVNVYQKQNESDSSSHVVNGPCFGRYIYIHDLPGRFNKELVQKCLTLASGFNYCPYFENGGFGPSFNDSSENSETLMMPGESWYRTNQFMLSVIFHNRMMQYECLTRNSSEASAIYAPFYAGLEVRQHLVDGSNLSVRDAAAVGFASWLRDQPEWRRVRGWDHFFVAGRIAWDFRRLSDPNSHWGSKLMSLPEVKNMTMLTIESSPFASNDFANPYPTYFHPSTDREVFEWQQRVRSAKRSYLFAFGGAPRPKIAKSIRGELISQCKNVSRNRCNLIRCKANDEICNRPANFMKMFMNTDFCLQPSGDSATRRSTFDSILAGCIPVFFHPASAYVQYLWHFPKNYTKYSVFIPETGIKNGTVSVEKILSQFSQDDISAMREGVIGLIPRIIYARNKLEKIEDGFDLAVKRVLARINDFTRQIREGKNLKSKFPESKSWKYYLTGEVGKKHEWDHFF